MKLSSMTKPQRQLISNLSLGRKVTYKAGNYTVVDGEGKTVDRIWPATFYALYDNDLVERDGDGDYRLSHKGWEVFESE